MAGPLSADDKSSPLPVRPLNPVDVDIVDGADPAFDRAEDAGVDVALDDGRIDSEDIVCGPCEDSVVEPRCLPCPKAPSAEEIEKHNATHMPYRN